MFAYLSTKMFILAQAAPPTMRDILGQQKAITDAIAAGWNKTWDDTLNGSLYQTVCEYGKLFAVATLIIFIIQWAREMNEGRGSEAFPKLMWPLLVATLLYGNGALLAEGTMAMRSSINTVNSEFLQKVNAGQNLAKAYQDAAGMRLSYTAVRQLVSKCVPIADQAEREKCLYGDPNNVKDPGIKKQLDELVASYSDRSFFSSLKLKVDEMIAAVQNEGPAGAWHAFMAPTDLMGTEVALMVNQQAFSNLLEVAMLITALVGPLAVGGSLLPVSGKPMFAWLSSFFSFGLAKLSFNMIAGLASSVIVNAQAGESTWLAPMLGGMAPWMAVAIAGGAGWAIFTGIANFYQQAAGTASSIARDVITRRAPAR